MTDGIGGTDGAHNDAIVEHIRKQVLQQGMLTPQGMEVFLLLMLLDQLKALTAEIQQLRGAQS